MRAAEPRAGARALVFVVVDLEADRDLASALVRPQLYNLGPGESLDGFLVHFKNRVHRGNVDARLLREQ